MTDDLINTQKHVLKILFHRLFYSLSFFYPYDPFTRKYCTRFLYLVWYSSTMFNAILVSESVGSMQNFNLIVISFESPELTYLLSVPIISVSALSFRTAIRMFCSRIFLRNS